MFLIREIIAFDDVPATNTKIIAPNKCGQ